jgi:hypothetical protein
LKGQEVVKVNYLKQDKSKNWQGRKVVDFEVEGLDELMKAFSDLGTDAIYKLADPSVEAAELILNRAKSKINDQSGELENALEVKRPGRQRNKQAYRIFAKVGFKPRQGMHGVPLELGHRLYFFGKKTLKDVKPRPYLRPAADESKEEVANIMANGMNKVLEEWGE